MQEAIIAITHGEARTEALACSLARQLRSGDVLKLHGDLGLGKTAFVRGLARGLGAGEDISSPTFAIHNVYTGTHMPLHHFDLYRISGRAELEDLGFWDVYGKGVIAIEWPMRVGDMIPPPYIDVDFQFLDDETRCITISGNERELSGEALDY